MVSVHFSFINSAEFDIKSFDIIVNGDHKKTQGKGYRALFNSLLLLTIREYINEVAIKKSHFYSIDSPLHGLSMPNGIEQTKNVRKGFFKYLIEHYGDDEIIIIENIEDAELPTNLGSDSNIKLIEFTQNDNYG